jgi:hypothetical protein
MNAIYDALDAVNARVLHMLATMIKDTGHLSLRLRMQIPPEMPSDRVLSTLSTVPGVIDVFRGLENSGTGEVDLETLEREIDVDVDASVDLDGE